MTLAPFTAKDLDELVNEFEKHSVDLLRSKAKDYASDTDRLQNFKEVCAIVHAPSPEHVCLTYMAKHMQSITNMVDRGDYTWAWVKDDGSEAAKSRIADAINYLFLLAAIMEARDRQKTANTPVQG